MMFAALVLDAVAWYGPATVTFPVQFPGDPRDPARNDVRVRFLGDRNQREERVATFDPVLGAWRATLYAKVGGRYRATLVRNGKEALVEPEEGIVELRFQDGLGIVTKGPREDRLVLDTGAPWVGVGPDLGSSGTPQKIDAVADAGATWVRVVPPADPFDPGFEATMDAVARRNLAYTLVVPEKSSPVWKRYAVAHFGSSPRLVGWEAPADLADPWVRATTPTAASWDALFENRPGPFVASEPNRIKALRAVVDESGWSDWKAPRAWKGQGAKGVAESDRLILMATPGAKLAALPLADGTYTLTTLDPATGAATRSETRVEHGTLTLALPGERLFVLRRKL